MTRGWMQPVMVQEAWERHQVPPLMTASQSGSAQLCETQ
jgi:hypothetical protein